MNLLQLFPPVIFVRTVKLGTTIRMSQYWIPNKKYTPNLSIEKYSNFVQSNQLNIQTNYCILFESTHSTLHSTQQHEGHFGLIITLQIPVTIRARSKVFSVIYCYAYFDVVELALDARNRMKSYEVNNSNGNLSFWWICLTVIITKQANKK